MDTNDHLYHYTSQDGLLGILQNKKLWMTNILYLNDSSEFEYTLNIVKKEIKIIMEEIPQKPQPALSNSINKNDIGYGLSIKIDSDINFNKYTFFESIYQILDRFLLSSFATESYVFSLSKKKDDLNQWRGYCPEEGGYCIEFNNTDLSSIINSRKNYAIKQCIYDIKEINKIVKSIIDKTNRLIENNQDGLMMSKFNSEVSATLLSNIVYISSFIKHISFSDELETRIIHYGKCNVMKYRNGKSMILPYMELPITNENDDLPISKIIIGPTPNQELSKMSVQHLVEYLKYNIEVVSSDIPYRSM